MNRHVCNLILSVVDFIKTNTGDIIKHQTENIMTFVKSHNCANECSFRASKIGKSPNVVTSIMFVEVNFSYTLIAFVYRVV